MSSPEERHGPYVDFAGADEFKHVFVEQAFLLHGNLPEDVLQLLDQELGFLVCVAVGGYQVLPAQHRLVSRGVTRAMPTAARVLRYLPKEDKSRNVRRNRSTALSRL